MACSPLGLEWDFFRLIDCNEWNAVKERIASTSPKGKAVLDLGCGDAFALFTLYHTFGYARLVGVDNEGEDVLMDRFRKTYDRTYPDRYTAFTNEWQPSDSDAIRERLSLEQFKKHFRLVNQRAEYFDFGEEQFNLIIICNVLHYMEANLAEQLLRRVQRVLHPNGLLYIRVKEKPQCGGGDWKKEFGYIECQRLCCTAFGRDDLVQSTRARGKEGEEWVLTNL